LVASLRAFSRHPDAMPPTTVVRIAMVFICGVFMPITNMASSLQTVAYPLPLTYSIDALRQAMVGSLDIQVFLIDLTVQILYSLVFLFATIKLLKRTLD
jgi:ABC-2 type transport system permease protein